MTNVVLLREQSMSINEKVPQIDSITKTSFLDRFIQYSLKLAETARNIIFFINRTINYSINRIQHQSDEENIDLKTLEHAAPLEDRIFDQEDIYKLGKDGWQPRRLVLTKTDIYLTHPGDEHVAERIPLVYCLNLSCPLTLLILFFWFVVEARDTDSQEIRQH